MKKNILVLISAVLLVAGLAFAEAKVEFAPSYVDVDTSLIKDTYTGILPNLSFSEADAIAQKVFNYTGANFYLDDLHNIENCLLYRGDDGAAKFQVNQVTGDIFFHKGMAAYDGDGDTPRLPTTKEAPILAKNHLKALGVQKNELILNEVNVFKKAVYDGISSRTYEKMVLVSFKRKLSGLPVFGASRVMVVLGGNGELVCFIVRWYDVQKAKVSGIKKDLKQNLVDIIKEKQGKATTVVVKKSELVLFDDGAGVIEPALFVQGDVTEGGATFPCDWMIPVLDDPKANY